MYGQRRVLDQEGMSVVGLHVEESGSEHWSARDCVSLTGLACKGLCVPGRSVVDVGGAFGEALELMISEHEELVLQVELLLPLCQR